MRLADLLRDHLDEIAGEWAQEVRELVPSDAPLPPLVLLDHVPALLADLVAWLDTQEDPKGFVAWQAQRHAADRFVRDFDLREVVNEYRVLRRVLIRRALSAQAAADALGDVWRLSDVLDAVIAEAAEQFLLNRERLALAQAERMQLALDAAEIGTWEWFPKTGVIIWDEGCRALFGMQPGAPVDYGIFLAAVHPDDRRSVEAQLRKNLANEDVYRLTFRTLGVVDGVQRWIAARGRVLARDAGGRAEHFVGTAVDVTLREQAAEFRERFLGIVSHDLRNPLNAIGIGAAAMLRREETPPGVARLAGRILASVDRMARMISDLLDLTRGRLGGGIPISPQPVDLPAVAKTTLDTLKASYPERQIVNCTRGDLHGEWDPDRLGQVIGNLVGNALEHGDRGAPVQMELVDAGEDVTIRVHNAGKAIPSDEIPHVFEAFWRGGNEPKANGGLGLGLFIANQIVRSHGGRIDVDSR